MMHSKQSYRKSFAIGNPISSSLLHATLCLTDSKVPPRQHPGAAAPTVSSDKPKRASPSFSREKKSKKSKKDPPPTLITKDGRVIEKPKRLRTAYNLFFQHHRELLLQSLPSRDSDKKPRNSHGKIDFTKLARTIAGLWKAVSEEEH